MYKLVFTALLLSTVTINAQKKPHLHHQIQSSKSKIDQEKERIVNASTIMLNDAKDRVVVSTEKFKKATDIYEQEKARHKGVLATEKKKIKALTNEIKKYK